MPKIKKPLKTIKEDKKGKNLEAINKKTKKVSKNPDLEKLAEKGKLAGYEVVKPKKIGKYLRSKKDKSELNNLDPKIKVGAIIRPKKAGKKKATKKPKKIG